MTDTDSPTPQPGEREALDPEARLAMLILRETDHFTPSGAALLADIICGDFTVTPRPTTDNPSRDEGLRVTVRREVGKPPWVRIERPGMPVLSGYIEGPFTPPPPAGTEALRAGDIAALAHVGHMYLDALDDDPENEWLTLPEAMAVTGVTEAVERAEAALAATAQPGSAPTDGEALDALALDLARCMAERDTHLARAEDAERRLAAVGAIHSRIHWCYDADDNGPDVYEQGTRFWPCATTAALAAHPGTDTRDDGETP